MELPISSWLLYAGQHDDAYEWAARRRLERHPVTGTLQIVETAESVQEALQGSPTAPSLPSLFTSHTDDYLLSLGVPPDWLPTIRKIVNDDQFLTVVEKLAEWAGVVENRGITCWDEYRDAQRTGRSRGLQVRERRAIWKVFEQVYDDLAGKRIAPWPLICRRAAEALESGRVASPFDAVVVDEVQDLKPQEICFLARLAAKNPGNLMLIGDAGQRIYPGGYSLRSLGIDVRGRSRVLRVNYRTTEQIRRFADRILPNHTDDLDGGMESRKGTRSLLRGHAAQRQ